MLVDNMRIMRFAEFYCMKTNNQHLVSFSDVVIILINGNRTCLCCSILSVIILMINKSDSDFANHLYDYRLDWTQLSSLTIINNKNFVIEHKRIIAIITGEEKLVDK